MPKILIVEDDTRISTPLRKSLELEHYGVDVAGDGSEGWSFLAGEPYDLVILDLNLPFIDGLTLCRKIREEGMDTLVLMLTARDATDDMILGLDSGADDYVVKPFELRSLKARVRSLLRRTPQYASTLLKCGRLLIDLQAREVRLDDEVIKLTAKEFMLIEHLARHPGQTFSREKLLERLWGWDAPQSDVVKAHVKTLRRKVIQAGGSDPIETVYGFGYRCNDGP